MRKLSRYLTWAFGVAWILQIAAGLLFQHGYNMAYTILLSLSMFAPMLAAAISRPGLRHLGWKSHIKKNFRWILVAWFLPVILGTLGAVIYFLITPDAWDTSFAYAYLSLGEEGIHQLENSGLTLKLYVVISIVSAVTYAPFANMLLAVGEEAGWRGTMYPVLKMRFGMLKGRIIGGVIWGIWHWPIMILAGYEYGTTYWGAPVTGPLIFCVSTVSMGILFDFLYEKTSCVWVPALCHGAINAFAGIPVLFLNPAYADKLLLGPLMVGIISGFPLILVAATIYVRSHKSHSSTNKYLYNDYSKKATRRMHDGNSN